MTKTGPTKTKVSEEGGPFGAKSSEIWWRIFNQEEDCKFYALGLCLKKVVLGKKEGKVQNFNCELCSFFEKGERPSLSDLLKVMRRFGERNFQKKK